MSEFLYIKKTFHIYKKKKIWNVFLIYKNSDTLQKTGQLLLSFYLQKARHLALCNLSWNVWVGIYIKKAWHFLLRDVFIYTKPDTSQKPGQFVLRFHMQKSAHFALRDYSFNFWNWRRGGDIFIIIKNALSVTFYMKKTMHFALRFYMRKSWHLCVKFLHEKNNALCVTFLHLEFIV